MYFHAQGNHSAGRDKKRVVKTIGDRDRDKIIDQVIDLLAHYLDMIELATLDLTKAGLWQMEIIG